MGIFDKSAIYTRLRNNAMVTPSETIILMRDLDHRLQEVENGTRARVEETKPARRGSGKLPKKEVSSD